MPQPLSQEKRQEWEENIYKQHESGFSIERWCRENHIPSHCFHYWRDKVFPKASLNRSAFTELADVKETGITVEYRQICIHLDREFDASTLKRFLKLLKETIC